ncbi:MAG: DUF2807 domain-containing protein [Lentimicrobiaceae bacterium]|jgi:hypothetical protein|nr:DUF2807 domain-containing protein [Lentimicrobiaceae bacterium]
MKKIFFLLIMALFSFCGCMDCINGKGESVARVMQADPFTKIEVNVPAHLYLQQGTTQSLRIEAQQNILDEIACHVAGNTLVIELERKCLGSHKGINIFLTANTLEKLTVNASADVETKGTFKGEELKLAINGSGSVFLNVEYDELTCKIGGSGKILLKGTAKKQWFTINGSGNIHSEEMPGSRCSVDVNGSGNCYVMALEKLDVSISGSGNVSYKGSPDITTNINGSGNIRKID